VNRKLVVFVPSFRALAGANPAVQEPAFDVYALL